MSWHEGWIKVPLKSLYQLIIIHRRKKLSYCYPAAQMPLNIRNVIMYKLQDILGFFFQFPSKMVILYMKAFWKYLTLLS